MIRSQVLLSEDITHQVGELSKKRRVSKSAMIRTLLRQALNVSESDKMQKQDYGYVYPLVHYAGMCPRIIGLKELFTVGAKIADVYVIDHSVFKYFSENKKLPSGFEYEILEIGRELITKSVSKKLVLRRGYFVPGLENPPGPRYLGIAPDEIIPSLLGLFTFALESNYHIKEGSEISGFMYPFADPLSVSNPVSQSDILPYGGYAYPLSAKGNRVEIIAVWGNNEGVQSFDAVDRYVVDPQKKVISEKDVPQKTVMLVTTQKSESEKLAVPLDHQFDQVLNDSEILNTASIVYDLAKKYGPRRIEFSFDGISELEYNEASPYSVARSGSTVVNRRGKIIRVASNEDLQKCKSNEKRIDQNIIYIDKRVVQSRSYDILNTIASLPVKYTVLYPGLSATAHAMRILTDFGHTAITVGNREFAEGDDVMIKTEENRGLSVIRLNDSKVSRYIQNLYDAKLFGIQQVGGKAYNLSLIKSKGFSVPHGVVLTTDFYRKVLKDLQKIRYDNTGTQRAAVISEKLWSDIIATGMLDRNKKYSVRSSATVEDQKDHSFAGQFETYLNVDFSGIKENVEKVMQSLYSRAVDTYISAMQQEIELEMAVIIQEMINPSFSGVAFSRDIQTNNEDLIVIEMTNGLAAGVVDGTARSTRAVYSRVEGEMIQIPDTQVVKITSAELGALVEMTISLERVMGGPQDIEWSIDKSGEIWLLQTRDL